MKYPGQLIVHWEN